MSDSVEIRNGVDFKGYVRKLVRRSGSSFFWAMRILPKAKQDAMFAIYAFCREVDDIADGPDGETSRRQRLKAWGEEIERLYDNQPQTPVARALQGPVKQFGLRKEDFLAVISGMEIDAGQRLRFADMATLEDYCDRVACAVGRLSNRVFGIDDKSGHRLAHALGNALQLTNILRDIKEDAQRDRLYLPEDLLRAHGVTNAGSLDATLSQPGIQAVCKALAGVTAQYFDEAEKLITKFDPKQVRPAAMMMDIYRATFRCLCKRGWRRLDAPVGPSKLARFRLVAKYMVMRP